MKILVIHQNVSDQDGMKKGIAMAIDKLKSIGFYITVDFAETTKQFTTISFENTAVGKGVAVRPEEILTAPEVLGKGYKLACLIFDASKVVPPATNPVFHPVTIQGTYPIQLPIQWYSHIDEVSKQADITYPEVLCQYFMHEICHYLFHLSGETDVTHNRFSFAEFGQKQEIDFYLYLIEKLKVHWKKFDALAPTTPVVAPTPTVNFQSLVKGMRSNRVVQLQKDLKTVGFFKSIWGTTGYFGDDTKNAVIAYQKSKGISPTGNYGPLTNTALQADLKKKIVFSDFGLLPLVIRKAREFQDLADKAGVPFVITEGFRSNERQDELYAQGRTKPGNIVTMAKSGQSLHNYRVAFDIKPSVSGYNAPESVWQLLGCIGQKVGFEWGGAWTGGFIDRPHFQWMFDYTMNDFQSGKVDYSKYE